MVDQRSDEERKANGHSYPRLFEWPHEHMNTPERDFCAYCNALWEDRDKPCTPSSGAGSSGPAGSEERGRLQDARRLHPEGPDR